MPYVSRHRLLFVWQIFIFMMVTRRQRFLLYKVQTIKISINTHRGTKIIRHVCIHIFFLPKFSIFRLRNLEINKIFRIYFMILLVWKWTSFSCVWLFAIPWTVARQASLSMEFFRQEYWSGLPLAALGGLPDPAIKPTSLVSLALAGRLFTTEPPGKPQRLP